MKLTETVGLCDISSWHEAKNYTHIRDRAHSFWYSSGKNKVSAFQGFLQ